MVMKGFFFYRAVPVRFLSSALCCTAGPDATCVYLLCPQRDRQKLWDRHDCSGLVTNCFKGLEWRPGGSLGIWILASYICMGIKKAAFNYLSNNLFQFTLFFCVLKLFLPHFNKYFLKEKKRQHECQQSHSKQHLSGSMKS